MNRLFHGSAARPENMVFFGTGLGAKRALRWRPRNCRIVAFADDDPRKWGKRFHGYPVISPQALSELKYDRILVTTTVYARQAYERLLEQGVSPSQICTLPDAFLRRSYPSGGRLLLTLCNPLLLVDDVMDWMTAGRREGGKSFVGKKRRTVLLAAPLKVMPVQGGGVARMWSVARFLRAAGYRIVLVTVGHAPAQVADMRECVDRVWMPGLMRGGGWMEHGRMIVRLARFYRAWGKKCGPISMDSVESAWKRSFFERRRDEAFEHLVTEVCRVEQPSALISLFAWTAPIFDRVPPSVLKIVDTIDVQHMRLARAVAAGAPLPGFDPPPCCEEEAALLSKADALMAIQSDEQKELRCMVPGKPVIRVEHVHSVRPLSSPLESKTVFFVGNDYAPNVAGMNAFLDQVWAEIRRRSPLAELVICGKVCDALPGTPGMGVRYMGVVPNIEPFYAEAAVVVNPVLFGTGLKIKAVEALAYGKCLVATKEGVLGLPDTVCEAASIVKFSEMAEAVSNLLESIDARRERECRARAFASAYLAPEKVYADLAAYLEQNIHE